MPIVVIYGIFWTVVNICLELFMNLSGKSMLIIQVIFAVIDLILIFSFDSANNLADLVSRFMMSLAPIAIIGIFYLATSLTTYELAVTEVNKVQELVQQIQCEEETKGQQYQLSGVKDGIESIHQPINVLLIEKDDENTRYFASNCLITLTNDNATIQYDYGAVIVLSKASMIPY